MLLIVAFALLAPVPARPLVRLVAWPAARLPGATGVLVRENAAAGVRRTAALAAPVLITVALGGSLPGATATIDAARAVELRERTSADLVVLAGGAGLDRDAVGRLRTLPGAVVSPTAASAVHVLKEGTALIRSDARVVEPDAFAATVRPPLAAGRLADLDDDAIVVNEEWEEHAVGRTVDVWLGDGTRRSLRIAAVLRTGTGDDGVLVTPRNAPGARVDRVDVAVEGGADRAAVAGGLRDTLAGTGAEVLTREAWLRAESPRPDGTTRLGFALVLGIALVYTGIALANVLVTAASDRVRDPAVLRLTGATGPQVLWWAAAEALTVVAVGAVLGALVAGLNLLGLWAAPGLSGVWAPVVVPWDVLGVSVGACAVLAVLAATVPAALALRRRPVESAGLRE
ncbi:hypothetical protein GCM10010405_35710 [Streptomyces macrosporus]|uniref:ABC3 transporter permease C-terminal domain-containing protein n=1 Tax=Streptomyces macrosporus TaxID=44032 RepID=A0ABN3K7S9_9ACTN